MPWLGWLIQLPWKCPKKYIRLFKWYWKSLTSVNHCLECDNDSDTKGPVGTHMATCIEKGVFGWHWAFTCTQYTVHSTHSFVDIGPSVVHSTQYTVFCWHWALSCTQYTVHSLLLTLGPQLYTACDVTCCTVSILHLCAVSIDRYYAIVKVTWGGGCGGIWWYFQEPLLYQGKKTKVRTGLMILFAWGMVSRVLTSLAKYNIHFRAVSLALFLCFLASTPPPAT